MMPTPPVVPSGLGFRLVLQVVASQVLEVVASHMVTNVVVVVLVVVRSCFRFSVAGSFWFFLQCC